ncbi:DUF7511 domain-containing protein [Halorussus pelagicus]|uniref:DUF7511 domain-containing protein n=1 Tax=Halorussus pelagicus TaxID=2505977 RepID=UPI001AA00F1A|nr:hypothetical protein [Halorussus pelagicus]
MSNVAFPDPDDYSLPTEESPSDRHFGLRAVVEEHDERPDECTLFPPAADDEVLVTEWITAEEGSYIDCDEMR